MEKEFGLNYVDPACVRDHFNILYNVNVFHVNVYSSRHHLYVSMNERARARVCVVCVCVSCVQYVQ